MKESARHKLLIKNMFCQRCILTVRSILDSSGIPFENIVLGEVELTKTIFKTQLKKVETELKKFGFELIETRVSKIVEDIKKLIIDSINDDKNDKNENFLPSSRLSCTMIIVI